MKKSIYLVCLLICLWVNNGKCLPIEEKENEEELGETDLNLAEKVKDLIRQNINSVAVIPIEKFRYHNYEDLKNLLFDYAEQYPKLAHLYTIGQSVRNRELLVMHISDNPTKFVPGKPHFKYVANMHGDETVGRELMVFLIHFLLDGYNKNPEVTDLLRNVHIHIMPSMNPDGFEEKYRGNANNKDLNRDFPDPLKMKVQSDHQVETNHVMDWSKRFPFVLSANLHGGALVANYPLDGNPERKNVYTPSADDAIFKRLALAYSSNHPTMYNKSPCDQFKEGITNGADWYSITGGMQDWNYFNTNAFEITLEVSCIKNPNENTLEGFWNENKDSLMAFIGEARKGIKGFVRDQNGFVVDNAIVHVAGIDHNVKSTCKGEIFRLLAPGTYDVTLSREGCTSETKSVIVTSQVPATSIDFTLTCQQRVPSTLCNNQAAPYPAFKRPPPPKLKYFPEEELVRGEEGDEKVIFIPQKVIENNRKGI